jgi:predicted nucleic-acid-binding Zn-ribbon protein
MKTDVSCPECGAKSLYRTTTNANGGHGPSLLPGLGGFFRFAQFEVVACAACGLTRFYAEQPARTKLPTARQWVRI